jgi:hypothetical protein
MVPPVVRRIYESLLSKNPAKITAAVTGAAELAEDERQTFFRLLDQQIRQKPTETSGYEVYRVLTDKDVAGAAASFANILQQTPTDLIPPAVGMNLATLLRAKPGVAQTLGSALKRITDSNSKAGAAAKSGQRSQRKSAGD